MARCDEGYRCAACGRDVEALTESGLYLRYLLGEIALDQLHRTPELHIHCDPALAQYIVDPAFPPLECPGPFAKSGFAAGFVAQEEARVTGAWRALQKLPESGLTIAEYLLTVRGG